MFQVFSHVIIRFFFFLLYYKPKNNLVGYMKGSYILIYFSSFTWTSLMAWRLYFNQTTDRSRDCFQFL